MTLFFPTLYTKFGTEESVETTIRRFREAKPAAKEALPLALFGQDIEGKPLPYLCADYDGPPPAVAKRLFLLSARLPWVAACGYSHSGGVWALWHVDTAIPADAVLKSMRVIGHKSAIIRGQDAEGWLDPRSILHTQKRFIAPSTPPAGSYGTDPEPEPMDAIIEERTINGVYYNPHAELFAEPTSRGHAAYERFLRQCEGDAARADVAMLMLTAACVPGELVSMRAGAIRHFRAQVQILAASGAGKSDFLNSLRKAFELQGADVLSFASARALERGIALSSNTYDAKTKTWKEKDVPTPLLLMNDENGAHAGSTAEFMSSYRAVVRELYGSTISFASSLSTDLPKGYFKHGVSTIGATTHSDWAQSCKNLNLEAGELRRQYFADFGDTYIPLPLGGRAEVDLAGLLIHAPTRASFGRCDAGCFVDVPDSLQVAHECLAAAFSDPAIDTLHYQAAVAAAFWAHEIEGTPMSYDSLCCGHAIARRGSAALDKIEINILRSAGLSERGIDGNRAKIQHYLLSRGGSCPDSSLRRWAATSALPSMLDALKALRREKRVTTKDGVATWVDIEEDEAPAHRPPPELHSSQVPAVLGALMQRADVQAGIAECKLKQDGRRRFMLKLRGAFYAAGLWQHPKAMNAFEALARDLGLARDKLENILRTPITFGDAEP